MELTDLLEQTIIADFKLDASLASYPLHRHDYGGAKSDDDQTGTEEAKATISVTARDNGEFKTGSGIRKVGVEVEVRFNGAEDDNAFTLLRDISEKVSDRLQPSSNVAFAGGKQISGRESAYSNDSVKTFGILAVDATQRIDAKMERVRVIARTFIASQLA